MGHQLYNHPRQLNLSTSLAILPAAKAYFFVSGTSTAATTYQNSSLSTSHANPVVANSAGVFAPIYLDSSILYKVELQDMNGAVLSGYPVDPCNDLLPQSGNTLTQVTGTNTIDGTLTPDAALVAGLEVTLVPAATNTGAVTLELNNSNVLSAVVGPGRTALTGGELVIGLPAKLIFNTSSSWTIANPANAGLKTVATVAGTNTITGVLNLITLLGLKQVILTPAVTNTGATTLNIDSLGAIAVQNIDGTACIGGELVAGIPALLVLNSGGTAWIIQAPANSRLLLFQQKSAAYTFTQLDAAFITYISATGVNIDFPATGIAPGSLFKIRNNGAGGFTLRQPTTAANLSWYNGGGALFTGNRTIAIGATILVTSFSTGFFEVEGAGIS